MREREQLGVSLSSYLLKIEGKGLCSMDWGGGMGDAVGWIAKELGFELELVICPSRMTRVGGKQGREAC